MLSQLRKLVRSPEPRRKLVRTIASIAIPIASFLGPVKATKAVTPNAAEKEDDIVCAFFAGWYGNPIYRQGPEGGGGGWEHWNHRPTNCEPPKTWTSRYIPNYPNSTWNPIIQLYDSADPDVLRWQDEAMRRAGIDIVISFLHGRHGSEERTFAKAIRMCKSVRWCIAYSIEGYSDPSPQKIYSDIKDIIDANGPSRNYAKIDGKWLVFNYRAFEGETAADRWRQAKEMLAADGYDIYLNGDVINLTPNHPWDAVHRFQPKVYQDFSNTNIYDSAWVSPGYWRYWESPKLERSLPEFISAWNETLRNKEKYRFIPIETWNGWHEGHQIEPGQEVVLDPDGYYPKEGGNYDYDFIDAIGPSAMTELHWASSGHRPIVPVKLGANDMIWEDGAVAEGDLECRIKEEGVRIGSSVYVPSNFDQEKFVFSVKARSIPIKAMRSRSGDFVLPEMLLYLDHKIVEKWNVEPNIDPYASKEYSVVLPLDKGNHTLEIAFKQTPTSNWDLVVNYLNICLSSKYDLSKDCTIDFDDLSLLGSKWLYGSENSGWEPDYDINSDDVINIKDLSALAKSWLGEITVKRTFEGFETGDFTAFPWISYGDREWGIVAGEGNSGKYSAKPDLISDDQSTSLETTLDCVDGEISFYYKVSSEEDYDFLVFYIDGNEKGRWSGNKDWTQISYPVAGGRRIFTWEYSKDSSESRGEDTAYIDDIVFPTY